VTEPADLTACRYCDSAHRRDFLCDPARRVLDALVARGQQFSGPTIEFDEPIPGSAAMLGEGTVLMRQLVVKAAVIPVAGTPRPALIFTGLDMEGRVLPSWIYPGDVEDIKKARRLVRDVSEMAIKAARSQRAEGAAG
jgi:hypothetical protein